MSFRAAPTYVLERPLDNVISGHELIVDAVAGRWGNPEAMRLGNENSEGALTWNVFRTLQEAGRLGVVAGALAGLEARRRAGALLLGPTNHARCRDRLGRARDDAREARAGRDAARRAGRVPARAGLRLGRDRGELRPELRRLRRPCRGSRSSSGCTPPRAPGSSTRRRIRTTRLRDVPRFSCARSPLPTRSGRTASGPS